jgi:hypothetical protein
MELRRMEEPPIFAPSPFLRRPVRLQQAVLSLRSYLRHIKRGEELGMA